jgi:pimeloyl-ACP methyl ester carboxylesterase
MIETHALALPHGITLSCRVAGPRGAPLLVFLHGFPEAAFVWDPLLAYFADPRHGGYRCVAPNLRGYADSSAPADVRDYRSKFLVQDVVALLQVEGGGRPAAALVAHDWGGALAWNLASQHRSALQRLMIVNSPHPGAFTRELQHNPRQQAASAYMNFLARPDAPALLAQDDYRRLWPFFMTGPDGTADPAHAPWLTEAVKDQYRAVWRGGAGLVGGCHYYGASPLRPPTAQDPGAAAVTLPDDAFRVEVPTRVLWGLRDAALLPGLLDGLDHWVPQLQVQRFEDASHWIVHEHPQRVIGALADFLGDMPTPARPASAQ